MRRRLRIWLAVPLATLFLATATAAAAEAPRLALVIGNAAYPARPLATTANDAALVAQALAQAGFDVTAAVDLDVARLRAAFSAFADAARAAGPEATVFVYLAGYGVQYGGDNYLVPVDAGLLHDDEVPAQGEDLGDLARALESAPAKARILVYDLARANPFATAKEMPLADGLVLIPPAKDTLVAFNAAPGMLAPASALPYGAYARALAETIGTPGLSPNTLFDRVRLRVGALTDGVQVPFDDGTIEGAAPLLPAEEAPAATAQSIDAIPVDARSPDIAYSAVIARDSLAGYSQFVHAVPDGPLSTRVQTLLAVRREALIWQAAALSGDPRADWTYLRRYPRGPHRFDARRRLAALHAALEPPPRFDIVVFPDLPPPSATELRLLASPGDAMRGLAPIPSPPAALLPAPDDAYYDALPPPAPAPAGLLPMAPPLPRAAVPASDNGRIVQTRPGTGLAVLESHFTDDRGATITLADAAGPIAELTATTGPNGARTLLETDAKNAVLSRTTTVPRADGLTIIQTGANGGVLTEIATRVDPEGARLTHVTNGSGEVLAAMRRDAQGVVVASQVAPGAGHSAGAATPASSTAPRTARPPPNAPSGVPTPQAPLAAVPAPQAAHGPAPAAPAPAAAPPTGSATRPPPASDAKPVIAPPREAGPSPILPVKPRATPAPVPVPTASAPAPAVAPERPQGSTPNEAVPLPPRHPPIPKHPQATPPRKTTPHAGPKPARPSPRKNGRPR